MIVGVGEDLLEVEVIHLRRQLATKTYYGSINWIIIFSISGILFLYCFKFICIPKMKKLHHYWTKRRVETTLDGFDMLEMDEELNRTAPRLDEETGEIIFATKNDYAAHIESKKTELEKMADMLERQRLDALNEKMMEEAKEEPVIMGPDGKPLLPDFGFDEFGNIFDPSAPRRTEEEVALQMEIERGREEGDNGNENGYGDGSSEEDMKKSKKSSKSSKLSSSKPPKKLSPKKIAALERRKKENAEFRESYKKAIYIPTTAEKVKVVTEAFHKQMLHGEEPLGFEVSIETRKWVESQCNMEDMQLRKDSNWFHVLERKEKREKEIKKHSKVKLPDRPKSAYAGAINNRGESNELGFLRKPKPPPLYKRIVGDKKSAGKTLEEGEARDPGMVSKGYGELPTRPDSPTAQRAKNMSKSSASKNQAAQEQANEIANCASESGRSGGSASRGVGAVDVDGTRTEYFSRERIGQPANAVEVEERLHEKKLADRARQRSMSPTPASRPSSPGGLDNPTHVHGEEGGKRKKPRPMTAQQFRRSMY